MKEIHRLHGFPKVIIVSDKYLNCIGNFCKELWKMSRTTITMSSTYQPQTDGQT